MDFAHLHVHSHYSLLDGMCHMKDLAAAAVANGMPAVALTDHGNLFGALKFHNAVKDAGVKPVIGYEAYVAQGDRRNREPTGARDAGFHLTLLAMNPAGFRNMTKLASKAYLEGFYYKPRIDKELLAKHHEGLICLSGCVASELNYHLLEGRPGEAEAVARWYRDLFGDRFYIEIQDCGLDIQKQCLGPGIELARKLGIPLVATNDTHYMRAEDAYAHEALLCVNTGKTMTDENRMRFGSEEFYFKSGEEMAERFKSVPDAILNTVKVAERCDMEFDFDRHHPVFESPGGQSCDDYLRELCEQGARERYGKVTPEVRERLGKELGVIREMGYSAYFLIVWDFVNYARQRGIPTGLRGSGTGAMVSYVLHISDIEPLSYKLLFERFLDPQRKEPPDLDIDICEHRREEVLRYTKDKYGHDCTAQIITFGSMAARGCLRDVGRVLEIPLPEVDQIAKKVPETLGITLREALDQEPELQQMYDTRDHVRNLFDIAMRLEGNARHASTHAAGLVMADRDLTDYIPLYKNNDLVMSQYEMGDLEEAGMLKMDFLGLRTLTIVDKTLELIEAREGNRPDMAELPLDDPKTYELLGRGDTEGVFQLGSEGMQELMRKLGPKSIEDIIAVVALYRPGPMGSGMLDDYVERRHGAQEIPALGFGMDEILEDTCGIITYQEQIMQICNKVAGMPLCDALTMIKAISKKKVDKIEKGREDFVRGACQSGMAEADATRVFDLIREFAGYGFNRAHATAYAFLAYKTAWLKANYPVQYVAAEMTCDMRFVEKIVKHIDDCRHLGIEALPPSVNESMPHFAVTEDNKVRYGLAAIRGIGVKACEAVRAEREAGGPYKSLDDFCARVDLSAVNRSAIDALIKSGAMDDLPGGRAQKVAALESAMRVGQRLQKDRRHGQMSLFDAFGAAEAEAPADGGDLPDIPDWSPPDLLNYEKEALGFYMSGHPLVEHQELIEQLSSAKVGQLGECAPESGQTLGGMVVGVKRITTKKGDPMARIDFEDMSGKVTAVVFPRAFQMHAALLQPGAIGFLRGAVDRTMEKPSFKVDEFIPVEDARARLAAQATLRLERLGMERGLLEKVRGVCEKHRGSVPLVLDIGMPDRRRVLVRAGRDMAVSLDNGFSHELAALLGPGRLRLAPAAYESSEGNGNGRWSGRRN